MENKLKQEECGISVSYGAIKPSSSIEIERMTLMKNPEFREDMSKSINAIV